MKTKMLAALALGMALTAPAFAYAQDKKDGPQLTVRDAISLADALRQLGNYRDKEGKEVKVDFRFDGGVLFAIATNIEAADRAQKNFGTVGQNMFAQYAKLMDDPNGKMVDGKPPEKIMRIPNDKLTEFNAQTEKALDAPSGQLWSVIDYKDLCIDSKPVAPCTGTNNIPPALLASMLKIIKR